MSVANLGGYVFGCLLYTSFSLPACFHFSNNKMLEKPKKKQKTKQKTNYLKVIISLFIYGQGDSLR